MKFKRDAFNQAAIAALSTVSYAATAADSPATTADQAFPDSDDNSFSSRAASTALTTLRINLHKGADLSSDVVTTLRKGVEVDVLARQGSFVKLRTSDGHTGFAKSRFLQPKTQLIAQAGETASDAIESGSETKAVAVSKGIPEIVVTASKREASIQDTAVTVQAVDEQLMDDLGIDQFDDYIKQLPNLSKGGRGPGQNEIYIRGTSVQAINTTIAEANGSAPNVGLYLDEQPVTSGGRNLDVYAADLQRIEVLPGPQGTLYGASSMAGTVKLVTNKPELDLLEFKLKASTSFTKNGDPSNSAEAVINLPLIENKLAGRLVVFSDNQGGYIDNIAGTFTPDPGINAALPSANGVTFVPAGGAANSYQFADGSFAVPGQVYPVRYTTSNNDGLVEENFNDASYNGFRLGLKYAINDDFSLSLSHHGQTIIADGVFDYDPAIGDLQVSRFSPDDLEDEFNQTAWTLEGTIGDLQLVYTGAYLNREVDQTIDYTNYANTGLYIRGYLCEYNTPGYHGGGGVGYAFDPTLSGDPGIIECLAGDGFAEINNENERFTHEIRLVGDFNQRTRFAGGIFYEDTESRHVGDFAYGDPAFNAIDPNNSVFGPPNTANNSGERGARVQFTNDITRPEEQLALFGELTFDITDTLSITGGVRWYDIDVGFEGFSAFRYGNRPVPNLANGNNANGVVLEADGDDSDGTSLAPDITGGRDYETNIGSFQPFKTDDTILKGTLSWEPAEEVLVYATWSEGYRPPGFNRAVASSQLTPGGGVPTAPASANDGPAGFPDYFIPLIYESDELTNIELGWKTRLADGTVQFNGALYFIEWENIQVGHIDSQNISFLTIVDNAGDADIMGIEGDLTWLATDQLTVRAAFSLNDTEITGLNPAFEFAVTDQGSELPLAPGEQFSLTGRYYWYGTPMGDVHFQLGGNYASSSFSSIIDSPPRREEQDSYFIADATLGIERDDWGVTLFVDNLTDERAQLHINTLDGSRKVTTNRPLTAGIRFTYSFFE